MAGSVSNMARDEEGDYDSSACKICGLHSKESEGVTMSNTKCPHTRFFNDCLRCWESAYNTVQEELQDEQLRHSTTAKHGLAELNVLRERIAELEAELATIRANQRARENAAYRAGWIEACKHISADVALDVLREMDRLPDDWTPEVSS